MKLSLVVCAYDMARELPRTLFTLSPHYQRGVEGLQYEIIVVDNGSPVPVAEAELQSISSNVRVVRYPPGNVSPAAAINDAVNSISSDLIGLFIDGARMVSPGIIRLALDAHRSDPGKAVGTLAFHIGPDVHMRAGASGYDQTAEDELLASIPWEQDGYRLFDISVLAGSSSSGWFGRIAESNGVFLTRAMWRELNGLDERFASPGGGTVNMDFWSRAVAHSDGMPWMLLGEGTFHQIHGGAATSGTKEDRGAMHREFRALKGEPFKLPEYRPRLLGTLESQLRARFSGSDTAPPRTAYAVRNRAFKVALSAEQLEGIQSGTMRTRYKGLRLAKNPFDLALYLKLLQTLAPRTIIEIGSLEGGSALWFRDQCRSLGYATRILSIDLDPPEYPVDDAAFLFGDAARPEATFPHREIATAPRPWLVVEDSAHEFQTVSAVLSYFHARLECGDYVVVEDGVVADLAGARFRRYEDGPNRAVQKFLTDCPDDYEIDTELCDFYGHNVAYCPNAWLRRR